MLATEAAMVLKEETDIDATVKTVDRAVRLLRCVSGFTDGAMLSAVARETGLGKGTVHRLLSALIDAGLVFQDRDTRRYRLGAGLARLAHTAHQHDIAAIAKPFLLRLADETKDTIYASVREGGAAVCVAREIGAFPIRTLSLGVGDMRPLGIGSGSLALLAFLPDDEITIILEKNAVWHERYPGHSGKALLGHVAETRRRGYSFVDARIVPGMNAIGVPILGSDGKPIAALSLAAIADRVAGSRVASLARLLACEAALLAKAMGLGTKAPPHVAARGAS